MAKLRVPDRRVYRTKPMPRSDEPAAIKAWIENELRQVTRSIEEIEGSSSFTMGYWPVIRPEDYGVAYDEEDAAADAVSDAIDQMIERTEEEEGAIWFFKGSYPVSRPILVPSNVAIVGIARGDKPREFNGSLRSVTGDFDIFKLAQTVENFFMSNMNIGHENDVTPTAGVAMDLRWLKSAFLLNNVFYNLWNGIDLGVARSIVIQSCYMRGLIATSSGIGTDSDGTPNHGFGIYSRSTQTLLDGNVGKENQFWDRDGPGVTVQPNAKGTSIVMRDIFINGGPIGEADDDGAVFENYTAEFTTLWLRGTSTVRVDRIQCRHAQIGVRVEYAPNREGEDRDGDETGVQMAADIRVSNASGEGNVLPYWITGFEKVTLETCQANSSAGVCFDIGDATGVSYPGFGVGEVPVRKFGGFARLINCLALTPRDHAYVLRSGKIRMENCLAAGYGLAKEDAVAPLKGVSFTATTTSQAYAFAVNELGTFTVRNDGEEDLRYTVGNSGVVESGGGVLVAAGDFHQFTRTNASTQSHLAVRAVSGTTTGEAGPEAPQDAVGLLIRDGATDGIWIDGGSISYDKSLSDHTPPTQPAIQIQDGTDRIWMRNIDMMGAEIDNNAEVTATEMDIREFVGNPYFFSTYPQVYVNTRTTTTYTLAMRDNGNAIVLNTGGAGTLTVPTNATIPFPIGAEIDITNIGAGTWAISPAGGVTVINNGSLSMVAGQGFTLRKIATDIWVARR